MVKKPQSPHPCKLENSDPITKDHSSLRQLSRKDRGLTPTQSRRILLPGIILQMWLHFHFSAGSYSFRFLFYSPAERKSQDWRLNNVLYGRRYGDREMYLWPVWPSSDPHVVHQRSTGKYNYFFLWTSCPTLFW